MQAAVKTSSSEITMLDKIRQSFQMVAQQSKHVTIRMDRLEAYAQSLPDAPPENVFDDTHHYIDSANREATAAYILMLDTINFGSGYKPKLVTEGMDMLNGSIYYTVSTKLKKHFEDKGAFSAADLATIEMSDIATVLGIDLKGHYSFDFVRLCVVALRELGQMIEADYEGSFMTFVEAANGSANTMVELLSELKSFDDVSQYNGLDIFIMKRAQIAAADLHLVFSRIGEDLFYDIEQLTMFADNAVPHVLYCDGVLEYSDELSQMIANGEYLMVGGDLETEIRTCAGEVVELIARMKTMRPMDVDHILWHRKEENTTYSKSLSHRAMTWFY